MITEREVFATLKENFRLAAEACELLATVPARGPVYDGFRRRLQLLEGCCRQIGWYRQDARWLELGLMMEKAHRISGHWLRTMPRTTTENDAHPLFKKLAENLRAGEKSAQALETKATGVRGLILPRAGLMLPNMNAA